MTIRPFADHAPELARRGLAVIPCPGADGKSPAGAVRGFDRWSRPPGPQAIQKFSDKWGDANVGVITSLSNVTVVDVDGDGRLVEHVLSRIGPTPLITATPSGGSHLWYAANDERNANLRRLGLAVDIKGTGAGVVIVPPSFRQSNGKPYTFASGSWDDLERLPKANLKALTAQNRYAGLQSAVRGTRNDRLFKFALREAKHCDDQAALVDIVMMANGAFEEPLEVGEALRVAQSAWGYEARGQNWVSGEAQAVVPSSVTNSLISQSHGSDAIALFTLLLQSHGARALRNEPFAISAKAMAQANVVGPWGPQRIRNARGVLLNAGLVVMTHKGGSGPKDPDLFQFSSQLSNSGRGEGV